MNLSQLDNPVWFSLIETHQNLALDYQNTLFYKPEYCPFGAFIDINSTAEAINQYSQLSKSFFIVGQKPFFDQRVLLKQELVCEQMLIEKVIDFEEKNEIIKLETDESKKQLLELVNKVQPGYFFHKTPDLGNYYGIYENNKLVAVSGERMKMNNFTEISAVVTHPDFTGKGYAKQLVSFVSNKIIEERKIPFLHVAAKNDGAIKLYEKLGFSKRRKISFWNFESKLSSNLI